MAGNVSISGECQQLLLACETLGERDDSTYWITGMLKLSRILPGKVLTLKRICWEVFKTNPEKNEQHRNCLKVAKKKIPFSRFLGVQKQKMSISAFTQIDKDEGEIVSHNLMVLCKMKKKNSNYKN